MANAEGSIVVIAPTQIKPNENGGLAKTPRGWVASGDTDYLAGQGGK